MPSIFLPVKKNLPLWPKSTFRYEFEWKDTNGKEIKPHNLTGYTGLCELVPVPEEEGSSPIILTTANGGIILGGNSKETTNGLIELYISKSQIEGVTWKKANYTLYLTESGGENVFPILSGRFVITGPLL